MILNNVSNIFYTYKNNLNYFEKSIKSELYNAYSDDSDIMELFDDWSSDIEELKFDCNLAILFNCDEDNFIGIYDSLDYLLDDTKDDENVYIEGYTDGSKLEYNFYVYLDGISGVGYYGYDTIIDIMADCCYINDYFTKLEKLFDILNETIKNYCDDVVEDEFENLVGETGYYC